MLCRGECIRRFVGGQWSTCEHSTSGANSSRMLIEALDKGGMSMFYYYREARNHKLELWFRRALTGFIKYYVHRFSPLFEKRRNTIGPHHKHFLIILFRLEAVHRGDNKPDLFARITCILGIIRPHLQSDNFSGVGLITCSSN